jgi:integrase
MSTTIPPEQQLAALTRIRKVFGAPGDLYEVIFADHHGRPVVPLTEWYRLRKGLGPESTRKTYLTYLMPYLSFLEEASCPWNAPPERLRPLLFEFHRDRLGCQIRPGKDGESIELVPTRQTLLRPSTLRAALRDFYLVLKDAGLYGHANPLSSEVLSALKREHARTLDNRGAPDLAGIRSETWKQSRRPTAFLRHLKDQGWQPELRRDLADVREGMHIVLDEMIDSDRVSPREKAVLQLLQNTGARLHEIVLMTVGGYRNEGRAGQAQVVNKGSMGREVKTVYFGHNPRVEQALTTYIEQVRPLHDPRGHISLKEVDDLEPLFISERGTPYNVKAFYWHWYKHYQPLRNKCPVRFSPHDIRHLFITEFLIKLKLACQAGTDRFDQRDYLQAREAFGSLVMGWSSIDTINIYDHTRSGEQALYVLADYKKELSKRSYASVLTTFVDPGSVQQDGPALAGEEATGNQDGETVWAHDMETLAWVKKLQQQSDQRRGGQK